MDPHTRRTILYEEPAVAAFEFGAKYIGIRDIILSGSCGPVRRVDIEMTAQFFVQQRAEEKTTVKPGHTHPFYISLHVDIGQVRTISNDPHLVFMCSHRF